MVVKDLDRSELNDFSELFKRLSKVGGLRVWSVIATSLLCNFEGGYGAGRESKKARDQCVHKDPE